MSDDLKIPDTGHRWKSIVNGEIPRSERADVYKPLTLTGFLRFVDQKEGLYAPFKSWLHELAKEYREREKGQENAQHNGQQR